MLRTLLQTLLVATALTGIASAAPITFDLQNVAFTDSTAATGSFAYDPTTGDYSDINIVTSAASYYPSFTFHPSRLVDITARPSFN